MNSLRNRVQLIGNPGMDPEVKDLEKGRKMAKFSLATNDYYRNAKGERVDETQWHNIVAWGKTAELVEKFVRKGKEVGLEGKLVSRSYDTKEGDRRYVTEVVLNDILLLGRKDS
jgi:single-strand DNA-binding protein